MATTALVDSDLERSIHLSLHMAGGIDCSALSVVAINGRVRLLGETRSYAEKRRAGEVAASVAGVRDVINQLRVVPCG